MAGGAEIIYLFGHTGHAIDTLFVAAGHDLRLILNLPEVIYES